MEINVKIDVHFHESQSGGVRHDEILDLLKAIKADIHAVKAEEDTMAATIQDVLTDVQAETTVEGSVITLLNSLSAQLLAANVPQATIDSIVGTLQSNTAALSAALAANTPAAATTPPAATAALAKATA
jgi:hypothetical protein